jgi:hypothetical protein
LSFWGEQWLGVLGGLLVKKPLFFDNYARGSLYREFESRQDVESTRKVLDAIITCDDYLSLMDLDLQDPKAYGFLTCKSLLLTLWADHETGLQPAAKRPLPLPIKDFGRFLAGLWEGSGKARRISARVKESFLSWLADRTGKEPYAVSKQMADTLEMLFQEIESELAGVALKDLDPRFIRLFLIEKEPA